MSRAYILDRNTLATVGLIDQSYGTLTYTRRYQATDTFEFRINRRRLYASEIRKGRLLYLPDEGDRVFLIEQIQTVQSGERSKDEMTVTGRSIEGLALADRLVIPDVDAAYDEQTAPAETAMKHYVDHHAVNPDDPDRAIPGLAIAADAAQGVVVDTAGRYQYVLDILQDIGLLSGMGWEVVLDPGASEFVFDVLVGVDRTDSVFFDFAFETLEKWDELDSDLDAKTVAVVAGQGEGTDRDIVVRPFAGSGDDMPAGFDRREAFVDARDVEPGNTTLLGSRGDAFLAGSAGGVALEATIHQFGSFRYREHWDLGDLVLVRNEERGLEYGARVVEVGVTIVDSPAAPEIVATLGRPFPTIRSRTSTGGGTGTADTGSGGGAPSGPAGGVLGGTYPDPGFAVDMATQAELDAAIASAILIGGAAGGDLSGTYPNPSVVDSSHDHNATTAPGVADTAGPGANITVDAAGDAGTAGTRARSAHGHRLNTYSSTPVKGKTAGDAGTATANPSRGDHSHPTDGVVETYSQLTTSILLNASTTETGILRTGPTSAPWAMEQSNGPTFRITMWGRLRFRSTAGDTFTLRWKDHAGTTIESIILTSPAATTTNRPFKMVLLFRLNGPGTSCGFRYEWIVEEGATNDSQDALVVHGRGASTAASFDSTDIDISGQFSASDTLNRLDVYGTSYETLR